MSSKRVSRKHSAWFAAFAGGLLALYLPIAANLPLQLAPSASAGEALDMWWPVEGARISGTQPFKGMLQNLPVHEYSMYWQVDGGEPVRMESNFEGYPHKEAAVDLSGWNWKGTGPYLIRMSARDQQGNVIGEKSANIWIDSPSTPKPSITVTATPAESTTLQKEAQAEPVLVAAQTASAVPADVSVSAVPQVSASSPAPTQALSPIPDLRMNVWWPTDGAVLSGEQPFKAMLENLPVSDYEMYWHVDGGQLNPMRSSQEGSPHKEAGVNLSGWTWRGSGPYTVTFIAKGASGRTLAQKAVAITVPAAAPSPVVVPQTSASTQSTAQPVISPAPQIVAPTASGNPLAGAKFYVNPHSDAKRQADEWRKQGRSYDADEIERKIASQPESFWMGGWNPDVEKDARNFAALAESQGATPVFVAYNIPNRDCGSYSAGGVSSGEAYRNWIRAMANGIGNRKAAVLLEPDALAQLDCLSSEGRSARIALLADAVSVFKSKGIAVYLDAGNANWIAADEMAKRLKEAGIDRADGFALNVSNFMWDGDNIRYGEQISAKTGGKHFVVDTSRNGNGPAPDYRWCNPPGRALGRKPTAATGHPLVDAYLWVKGPGGSDGSCDGAPPAGIWFPEYALDMAKRSSGN